MVFGFSIWVVIWLFLSVSLIVFLGWTFVVLTKQKIIWRKFSKKYKLRYSANPLMESPSMDGVIEDYKFNFFTSEHLSKDARGVRILTAIEITLNTSMPIDGAIASGTMVQLVKELDFKAETRPKHKAWHKDYVAAGDNKAVLNAYLTDERIEALAKLMKIKNAWIILIFKNNTTLLRIDVPDPFVQPKELENIKTKFVETAKILELKKGEAGRLKSAETKSEAKDVELEVDESTLEATGLELEEDEPKEEVVEEPGQKEKPDTEKS